jgi:bifunctional oligoribonuclease and PAP phosphatase NrnA
MTENRVQINNLNKLIDDNSAFLLTSHQDPDGDSIGSLIGLYNYLKNLGKQAVVYSQGNIPAKYQFLDPDKFIQSSPKAISFKPQIAIVLECPKYERIGFVEKLITPDMTIINIDHHEDNDLYGNINIINTEACAVGEMLYEIFESSGKPIGPDVANPLYAALLSDTGCFKFANTNSKCLTIAAALVDKGARPKPIAEHIFATTSAETLKLIGFVLQNMQLFSNGKICVFNLTKDDPRKFGASMENSEGLIDYTMMISGVDIGVLFKEFDSNTIKVSLRSRDSIDVCAYARKNGGGGHTNAAGFTLHTELETARQTVIKELSEYLNV